MKLQRPLCFLDCESAVPGNRPDAAVDKIVHLAIVRIGDELTSDNRQKLERQFNPGFLMKKENTDIHGIGNEMAATYPKMTDVHAKGIQAFIAGCDIAGFNCTGYDNPLLWEECHRVGVDLDFSQVNVVDAGNIFKAKESRTLTAAVKFYCDREHVDAHGAIEDVYATIDVLEGQLQRYPDLAAMSVQGLAEASVIGEKRVDLFGIIVLNKDGVPCFGTKRNQGVPVRADAGYAAWIIRSDFPANVKMHLNRILNEADSDQGQML